MRSLHSAQPLYISVLASAASRYALMTEINSIPFALLGNGVKAPQEWGLIIIDAFALWPPKQPLP